MNSKYIPSNFHTADETKLRFSNQSCVYDHHGPDNQGIRIKYGSSYQCLACLYYMPMGPFEHQFNPDIVQPAKKIQTPEESKLRHSEQVKAYHKRNPEKLKKWQQKWASKPETKAKARAKYHEQKEEKKEATNERQRAYYAKNREEIRAKQNEANRLKRLKEKQDGNQP